MSTMDIVEDASQFNMRLHNTFRLMMTGFVGGSWWKSYAQVDAGTS